MVTLIGGTIGCAQPAQYSLTISSTEGGLVTTPGEGTFTYDEGTVVNLVAIAGIGYHFVGWTGDVDDIPDVNDATTTITIQGSYEIRANFEAGPYSLSISSTTGGSTITPGEGAFVYDAGTAVQLVARADEGYVFVEWTGDVDTIAAINNASTAITMDGDCTITAGFAIPIYDWYDLDAIRDNMTGSYVLMNDLDSTTAGYPELASSTANEGKGWQPIGTIDSGFSGTFDGQGYEIKDLSIARPDEDHVGLVGRLGWAGAVQDVGLVSAAVTGGSIVGSLVGWNQGIASNCYSTGTVSGNGGIGGLAGANYGGIIDSCYSASSATGDGQVGGLVGWNQDSTVSNSYSIGSVIGESSVGGLIGYNQWQVTVSNSYYDYDEVLINGRNAITCGALFARDFDEWLASDKFLDVNRRLSQEDGYYLIDDVSDFKQLLAFGQDDTLKFRLENDLDLASEPDLYIPYLAGEFDGNGQKIWNLSVRLDSVSDVGLFGYLTSGGTLWEVAAENGNVTGDTCVGSLVGWNGGTVADSYATGTVTGRSWVGGLVGSAAAGTLRNSYFAGSVSGDSSVGGLIGEHMQGIVSNSHYKVDEVLINERNVITIGALFSQDFDQWLANHLSLDINERLSEENGYYVINDVSDFKQLLVFGEDSSLKFKLVNDLDLMAEPGFYIPYLAGAFDGDGHGISNLGFNFGFASRVGLFGFLAASGRVSETGVENVDIIGADGVGSLVGWNNGMISESYSTGSVMGSGDVGGLIGFNGGTVDNCYSSSSITGDSSIGGLLGRNWDGTVSDSYSTGSVTGQREVGGLVGWNKGTIRDCYSTGRVTGVNCVGGLVGKSDADWYGSDGHSSQSFWDLNTSGIEASDGGTGKTTGEMRSLATFSAAGWNIAGVVNPNIRNPSYIWNIVDAETYPFLSWQPVS